MEKLSYARKNGGSLMLAVTGILEQGKQYRIIKKDDGTITITEAK